MKKLKLSLLAAALAIFLPTSAHALEYETCLRSSQSSACLIAFEKLKTIINPVTKKKYFHDGIHIQDNGSVFIFPKLYVATPDLDNDSRPELIVGIPDPDSEEMTGQHCLPQFQCPYFIIQDRALPDQKRTTDTYKTIGPFFAYSVALSTDEVVDNFSSLRVYYDGTWKDFDTYQYDGLTDNYLNMSTQP